MKGSVATRDTPKTRSLKLKMALCPVNLNCSLTSVILKESLRWGITWSDGLVGVPVGDWLGDCSFLLEDPVYCGEHHFLGRWSLAVYKARWRNGWLNSQECLLCLQEPTFFSQQPHCSSQPCMRSVIYRIPFLASLGHRHARHKLM